MIELYTCESGIDLFKKGRSFGVWDKYSQSYKDADINIKILVSKDDITEKDDGYDITDLTSVEIIG